MKLLYICSSQFSGSTLISFLLGSHSAVATIGHTTGWRYAPGTDFTCSCGARIRDCPLFVKVRARFEECGLTFDPQDFGTDFRLSRHPRLNQLLTGPLPGVRSSNLEHLRDKAVCAVPRYRHLLARQERANSVLMQTVLDHMGATVYLDNSHSPYRFRRLSQGKLFSVLPIHLIRDPRGVTLSLMTNSGYSITQAVTSWLSHQENIWRITNEHASPHVVHYESLCRNTQHELDRICRQAGLTPEPFKGDFKGHEHHILGNRMRLQPGELRLDERWRRDLSSPDRRIIEHTLTAFCARHADHPLSRIIQTYLGEA